MVLEEDSFGIKTEIELCPGGTNIPVSSENRLIYIVKRANYTLNIRTKE